MFKSIPANINAKVLTNCMEKSCYYVRKACCGCLESSDVGQSDFCAAEARPRAHIRERDFSL